MTVLRAIPTRYRDILFRSKLEADWAITLDAFQVAWRYEREGRYWGTTYYAPDFWLPDSQQWVEVKGAWPVETDFRKWKALAGHWEGSQGVNRSMHFRQADHHGVWLPILILAMPNGKILNIMSPKNCGHSEVCLIRKRGFLAAVEGYPLPEELKNPTILWGEVSPFACQEAPF